MYKKVEGFGRPNMGRSVAFAYFTRHVAPLLRQREKIVVVVVVCTEGYLRFCRLFK